MGWGVRPFQTRNHCGNITVISKILQTCPVDSIMSSEAGKQEPRVRFIEVDESGAYGYVANKRLGRIEKIAIEGLEQ